MKKVENELFICQCNSERHQLIFTYFPDDEVKTVYLAVHLIPERRILKRIWLAIKYIFGKTCKYGHFEDFIFKKEDADKLQKIVDVLKSQKL